MKRIALAQGSDEWKAYRASHLNASDAPKMLGDSSYKSRNSFIKAYLMLRDHGIEEEVGEFLQQKYQQGHEAEERMRDLACEMTGEELLPVVGESEASDFPASTSPEVVEVLAGKISASFDGLDFGNTVIWEHKLWNKKIAAEVDNGVIPLQHRIQMEQQMMISGAERGLFMASIKDERKNLDEMCHLWCEPDLVLRERIIDGWMQFLEDIEEASSLIIDAKNDDSWLQIERQLIDAEARLEQAKADMEAARQLAIQFSGGGKVVGSEYQLTHSTRSGSIAYAKAFKDLGIDADLEPYRGKPTNVVQIKRNKK